MVVVVVFALVVSFIVNYKYVWESVDVIIKFPVQSLRAFRRFVCGRYDELLSSPRLLPALGLEGQRTDIAQAEPSHLTGFKHCYFQG